MKQNIPSEELPFLKPLDYERLGSSAVGFALLRSLSGGRVGAESVTGEVNDVEHGGSSLDVKRVVQ